MLSEKGENPWLLFTKAGIFMDNYGRRYNCDTLWSVMLLFFVAKFCSLLLLLLLRSFVRCINASAGKLVLRLLMIVRGESTIAFNGMINHCFKSRYKFMHTAILISSRF